MSTLGNMIELRWYIFNHERPHEGLNNETPAKPPFGGAEHVLNYLARYTHRVAISNHRLVAFQNDRVSFRWRDYAHGGKQKVMTLSADQFLRRFLLHVLPKGLVRIRHFGLLANRRRETALARCRELRLARQPSQSTRKQRICRVAPHV
jgi:Putative transposase